MCPWNLIVFWDWCSWRSWKGGGRWRSGGGCWTCSATQGSRGSGRRADSGSQGTLTSPHEGFPRILQAPRGPGTGTHTWCTCFLSWCGAAEEQEELWCQLRLEGTGWRGWRPWCRLSTPRMLRPAPPPTHTHHLPHPSETHAPKHASHTHTLAHACVFVQKKAGLLWDFSCDSSSPRCGSEEWPQGQIVENWAKVLQERTFHLLSHIGG